MHFDLNNKTTVYENFKAHKETNKCLTVHKILITGYFKKALTDGKSES